MSKRYIFPQQQSDRKKAKLDISISDHNFPLSQNGPNKEPEQNNWGDDNDDEILLLASQACEDVYNDISSLPDYSLCMQPQSTSTQLFDPGPSTSKANFTFKKPTSAPPTAISSNLKDKCNRISSPLPGMSSKLLPKTENVNVTDDLIFNDKICKGQDSDFIYKQLLQLQEENNKLKSENGKLLEKCVTKEGEASILRTQLKSCQVAVDNARMEKIKAQEKVQMEWTEKLTAANGKIHELSTQLDFKNLEIISIKERCKMLESNKVKLTQVMVTNNDISLSQRNNTSIHFKDPPSMTRKVKTTSNAVQTEDKAHFLKLHKSFRSDPPKLSQIIPSILEPITDQHSILEYNEKLQKQTDLSQNKCRVYSTFHRIPSTPAIRQGRLNKINVNILNEDLTNLAVNTGDEKCFRNIVATLKAVLEEVCDQLEIIGRKVTTAFQREMDEKYIDVTSSHLHVTYRDLLCAKPLYKEEQAILARRLTAILACILRYCSDTHIHHSYDEQTDAFIQVLRRICSLLDNSSCALLYSGLLLSTTILLNQTNINNTSYYCAVLELVKIIISSRPMPFVSCHLLKVLRKLSMEKEFLAKMCPNGSSGNLRLDYDQGVLLYKKDSCHLQVLLKQVEAALKCIESDRQTTQACDVTSHLLVVYSNIEDYTRVVDKDTLPGCDCQLILLQVIVYALRICAAMLHNIRLNTDVHNSQDSNNISNRLLATCRSGIQTLYACVLRDVEFNSQLSHNEGHLVEFVEIMNTVEHSDTYCSMVSELTTSFQSSPEDTSASFHRQPWVNSFHNFTIAD